MYIHGRHGIHDKVSVFSQPFGGVLLRTGLTYKKNWNCIAMDEGQGWESNLSTDRNVFETLECQKILMHFRKLA